MPGTIAEKTIEESSLDDDVIAATKRKETDTGSHQFHMDSWISCAPYERLPRMEIVDASDSQATPTMPFLVQHARGAALMHGGALMSLADTALMMAIKSIRPPCSHCVTVHAAVEYFRPVTQGVVTAWARVTYRDGRKISGVSSVFDESQEQLLTYSAVLVIVKDARIKGVSFADSEKQD